jgi:hemerythrin superfamily protein
MNKLTTAQHQEVIVSGTDIFAVLTEDHRRIQGLFERFEQTNDPDVAFAICDELIVHAMAEEELVYGVLATKVNPGRARDARRENVEAKELITQIESAVAQGSDVAAPVAQLRQTVQHHVEEQESEIFPEMREKVPSVVGEMGADYVERKKAIAAQVQEARNVGYSTSTIAHAPPSAGEH